MNAFDHVDFSNYDLEPRDPIVHSSFYSSPNGKRSVRAYEIVNSNPNIRKLKKNELDEPRFENSLSKFAKTVKNMFVSDTPRAKITKISDYGIKTRGVNVKKGKINLIISISKYWYFLKVKLFKTSLLP